MITHKFSEQIRKDDTIGGKYEYINHIDVKRKNDDSLLTRSRFMHINAHEQQANNIDEKPKRNIDHIEELEILRTSIAENEEVIHQLESQLQKLEESIQKVILQRIMNSI